MKYLFSILALAGIAWGQSFTTAPPRLTTQERQQLKSRQATRVALATQYLNAERSKLQVQDKTTFIQRTAVLDSIGQLHVRYQQRYDGVPVLGAQLIVHINRQDQFRSVTGTPVRDLALKTSPTLTAKNAIDLVKLDYPTAAGDEVEAETELVVYVKREAATPSREPAVQGANLAWRVRVEGGPTVMYYYVDAHGGKILRKASAELRADYLPVNGTGRSGRYPSPTPFAFSIAEPQPAGGSPYRLRDPLRGNSTAWNMRRHKATSSWKGDPFWNNDTTWGTPSHFDYETMSVDGVEAKASGFEAALAMQRLWDLLANVFKMNGLDGAGKGMTARVHAVKKEGVAYGDAYWDDKHANFGDKAATDNQVAHSRTDMSTVAHEFGHAMWQYALDAYDFEDEAKGLNEGQGDITAALTRIYHAQGGTGNTLPVQADLSLFPGRIVNPLSYTEDTGQQGLAYYVENMGQREEHTQGCAYGHAFVFLAHGAAAYPPSSLYSIYLPGGMVGIGVQKAAEIWDLALQAYLTPTATFASTRQAYLQAAQDLFGIDSVEVKATMNAFRGIYVGTPAPDTEHPSVEMGVSNVNEDEQTAFVTMNASDDLGVASLELRLDGVSVPLDKGLGLVKGAGPKSWAGYVSLEGLAPGQHTLLAVAKDSAGKTTDTLHQFVLNGRKRIIHNSTFEDGWTSWGRTPSAELCSSGPTAFLGSGCAQFSTAGAAVYQQVTIPSSATAATLSYRLRAETFASAFGIENLRAQVTTPGGVLLGVLANHTQYIGSADSTANGYRPYSVNLLAYKGQTVRVGFLATNAMPGRFKVDNINLVVTSPVGANLTVNADAAEGLVSFHVTNITNLAADQVKSVALVINGQEVPSAMTQVPYFTVLPTNLFVPNAMYTVKARIRNQSNTIVGESGEEQFIIHPVTNLLMNPGFENNAYWGIGASGASYGEDDSENTTKLAFTGVRYGILDASQAVEAMTQNVFLPGSADVVTLGFRVKINRAVIPDYNDKLLAIVMDLSNNILGTVAILHGGMNTNQPGNYRGYMAVKANLTPFKGQTVRIQFRSINTGPHPTSFYIDATSVVAKNFGVTQ